MSDIPVSRRWEPDETGRCCLNCRRGPEAHVLGERCPLALSREEFATKIARLYDVPPWLVSDGYSVPRFPRLRWALRRVWPVKAKGGDTPDGWGTAIGKYEAAALDQQARTVAKFLGRRLDDAG